MPNGCSDDDLPWAREAESRLDTKYPYGNSLYIHDIYVDSIAYIYIYLCFVNGHIYIQIADMRLVLFA